jgi:novobiocin biosynthesis protein NovU/D-mycarose 3-C-methyltransferase
VRITACQVCGAATLFEAMDFGRQALANAFLRDESEIPGEPRFPLTLCLCESCGHVQINEVVDPAVLFRNYLYVTGVSEAVQRHGRLLVELVGRTGGASLRPGAFLLEAASNDGTILSAFQRAGWKVLGVDPAENVAAIANGRGIPTIPDFFGVRAAEAIVRKDGPADVVLARHVIAHVAALHDFVSGLALALRDDGIAAVECSHVLPLYRGLQYDQVYHEHLGYFSVTVLRRLLGMHGLDLFAVEEVDMHGGSIVAFAQKRGGARATHPSVERMVRAEAESGLATREAWVGFARRAYEQREALTAELRELKRAGKRVAAYGAAAKGQVMLQFCGVGPDLLDFVVDKSELKQGRLTPGMHLPILAPEAVLARRPDVLLLSSWNYAEEIQRQQKPYLDAGGRLLHPLPLPHYL